jgi:hypothetical protein
VNYYGLCYTAALVAAHDLAADPASADPVTLDLSGPVTVEVGRKCILTAETTARKVTWKVPPGADAMPLDGKRLAVWAPPGTYTFAAMVPAGDDVVAKEIVLTVTGARPPPVPVPVPVPDVDPLIAPVQAAYTADSSATKAADKAALAAVFRALADATTAQQVQTAQNLYDLIHNSVEARVPGRLKTVRAVVGTELGKYLPTAPATVLTVQHRNDAAAQLKRAADILDTKVK